MNLTRPRIHQLPVAITRKKVCFSVLLTRAMIMPMFTDIPAAAKQNSTVTAERSPF